MPFIDAKPEPITNEPITEPKTKNKSKKSPISKGALFVCGVLVGGYLSVGLIMVTEDFAKEMSMTPDPMAYPQPDGIHRQINAQGNLVICEYWYIKPEAQLSQMRFYRCNNDTRGIISGLIPSRHINHPGGLESW